MINTKFALNRNVCMRKLDYWHYISVLGTVLLLAIHRAPSENITHTGFYVARSPLYYTKCPKK